MSGLPDLPLGVYISSAEHEQAPLAQMWPPVPPNEGLEAKVAENAMLTNAKDLAGQLRGLGVTVHDEVLAGEHHNTTWPAAVTRGLLALHAESYRLA